MTMYVEGLAARADCRTAKPSAPAKAVRQHRAETTARSLEGRNGDAGIRRARHHQARLHRSSIEQFANGRFIVDDENVQSLQFRAVLADSQVVNGCIGARSE
jgi:hypothetical protein